MSGNEIRRKYLEYMEMKDHVVIPSSSLVPENDSTTLFTGSGMQPLIGYLMGEEHPKGTLLADSQKCFRAEDIEEVGDNRHTTFFEMLGNWSLGDYYKKEQLTQFYAFLTDEIGLDPERLYATVYAGDDNLKIPRDDESTQIWKKLFTERGVTSKDADLGSEAEAGIRGIKEGERIFSYRGGTNWWSRAGAPENMPNGEPGGPDSEVFYDFGTLHNTSFGEHCHPNCDCGRFMEIGNSVFMEYIKTEDGTFSRLPQKNVDFGGGLERITAAKNNEPDIFKIDVFQLLTQELEKVTQTTYLDNKLAYRVILDHMRATVFLISDGVYPSNKDQGYFVRRLIRRAVMKIQTLNSQKFLAVGAFAHIVSEVYATQYPEIKKNVTKIDEVLTKEETQFRSTLEKGLKQFNKISLKITLPGSKEGDKIILDTSKKAQGERVISGKNAFDLFTTYGFPIELTEEIAKEKGLGVDLVTYKKLMEEHRSVSRAGADSKFKGGLADNSLKVTAYHTATHLLLAALRNELGAHVHQAGSNITGERLRFDFTHTEKVDKETLKRLEEYVNNAISKGALVSAETMPKSDAESDPLIEGSFWERYPDKVTVYTISDSEDHIYSKELCGGPHVESTSDLGTFRILKEESSAAGVRRIKAVLE